VHERIQSIKGLKETAEATEANFRHFKALVEARVDGKADVTEVQGLKTELKQNLDKLAQVGHQRDLQND